MPPYLENSAARGEDSTTDTDPNPSTYLHVLQTARSIAGRVRQAMLPDGVEFQPLRVLVVDDHPDAADALAAVLELLDCPVRACHDGPSALAVAAEFRPQVCLLDLVMPKMDGLELAARLREQAGGRPLLLVAATALGDVESRTQTALAGFHYHLTKPIDTSTLINALVQLGQIVAQNDEVPPTES